MADQPFEAADIYLAGRGWRAAQDVALQALDGKVPPCGPEKHPTRFKNGVLRWALSNSGPARIHWEAFRSKIRATEAAVLKDRDEYVAKLWATVDSDDPRSPNRDLRELIFDEWGAEGFYRRQLFLWFLLRFEPGRAFRLYHSRLPASAVYSVLPLMSFAAVALAWRYGADGFLQAILTVLLGALAFLLVHFGAGLPWRRFVEALLPRLAAAVAIGYLFLTSAGSLSSAIATGATGVGLGTALVLLLVTLLATAFHASRRIHPPLGVSELGRRSLYVFAMGLTYSALGFGVLGPLLTTHETVFPAPLRLDQAVLLAAIAFSLGMALELAWEERPLTEPL